MARKKNEKLIIGIDFGHCNTAASYVKISANGETIGNLSLQDNDIKTYPSRIYKLYDQEEGAYRYMLDKDAEGRVCGIEIQFKNKIDKLSDEQKKAFSAYVKLIFQKICENNKGILYNGGKLIDCSLYIAAPSQWDSETKREYGSFIQKAIGHEIQWVISENEAAYFNYASNDQKDNNYVLIIDYGSRTIDFALIHNNKQVSLCLRSCDLGASLIENLIFRKYKNDENGNYNIVDERTRAILRDEKLLDVVNPDNCLIFHIREKKEQFYNNPKRKSLQSSRYNVIKQYLNYDFGDEYRYKIPINFQEFIEGNGVLSYKFAVKTELKLLKEQMSTVLGGANLSKIVLSGGACRMPWFINTVEEVFNLMGVSYNNGQGNIIVDTDTDNIVSKGIVKYALARHKCLNEIYNLISEDEIKNLYLEAHRGIINNIDSIKSLYKKFEVEGEGNRPDDLIKPVIRELYKEVEKEEIQEEFIRKLKTSLLTKIEGYVKEKIKNFFNVEFRSAGNRDILDGINNLSISPTPPDEMYNNILNDLLYNESYNNKYFKRRNTNHYIITNEPINRKLPRQNIIDATSHRVKNVSWKDFQNHINQLVRISQEYAKSLFEANNLFETTYIRNN